MADTAITAVLTKFGELAANEARVLIEVGDAMMLLRDRLEWLQAFIRDADRKRRAGTDGLTRVWVRQTRDVAFQAEDALDEFFYEVDLRSQGYRGWKMWGRYLMGFGTQIVVSHRLSSQINKIKGRLNQIADNQKEYKIEHIPSVALTSSTTAIAAWGDDLENAVGFGADVQTLEQMILLRQGESSLMFISIVGESGVGKRTLGKLISADMEGVFTPSIRFNMPPDSTTEVLLEEIHGRIVKDGGQPKGENADSGQPEKRISIPNKIRRLLRDQRYLMILGGITSKSTLSCLRASLPDDNNASTVLLTLDTESEEVAWHANKMNRDGTNRIHHLSRLDVKTSGELFRARAIRKGQSDEDVRKYDKIVYDITGGYPLAIVVLAGLLRFKENPGQWEAVLQQLRPVSDPGQWEAVLQQLRAVPDPGQWEAVLEKLRAVPVPGQWEAVLEHLRPGPDPAKLEAVLEQLRPGPVKEEARDGKGVEITGPASSKHQSTRTTLEKVFWESFEDLTNDLKSCFLYFATYSKNTYQMADELVRMWIGEGFIKAEKGKTLEEHGYRYLKELVLRCLVENIRENTSGIRMVRVHPRLHGFLQSEAREAGFVEFRDMNHVSVPPSVRRLSFCSFDGRFIKLTKKFRKLRSFMCRITDGEESSNAARTGKDCSDLKFLRRSKFLRVISVVGLRLDKLPDEIGALVHLRYLRVDWKGLKELPSSIGRLLNLQTLDIRGTQVEVINPQFWKIKVLRHVLAKDLTLPATIEEELDELQTLHGVKPHGEEWNRKECALHKMTKIRSLKLHGFKQDKHGAALKSALPAMHLLGRLKLQGDVIPSCVFTAESLQYLQKIGLEGKVKWHKVTTDVCTVRPNLLQVKLRNSNEVPQRIKEEMADIVLIEK